jgi:hypothetical protein
VQDIRHDDDAEALEVAAACGHLLSPERDDLPPCDGCARCDRCCGCGRCPRCGERWYLGCTCPASRAVGI